MEHLFLAFLKFDTSLVEFSLSRGQLSRSFFAFFKFYAQILLRLIHFFDEIITSYLYLAQVNLENLLSLICICLGPVSLLFDPHDIFKDAFHFSLKINSPISDCSIVLLGLQVFVVNVNKDLLLFAFIFVSHFGFPLDNLFKFARQFSLSLFQQSSFFVECSLTICQSLFSDKQSIFSLLQFSFMFCRQSLHHRVDISGTFLDFFGQFVHLDLLLELISQRIVLFCEQFSLSCQSIPMFHFLLLGIDLLQLCNLLLFKLNAPRFVLNGALLFILDKPFSLVILHLQLLNCSLVILSHLFVLRGLLTFFCPQFVFLLFNFPLKNLFFIHHLEHALLLSSRSFHV